MAAVRAALPQVEVSSAETLEGAASLLREPSQLSCVIVALSATSEPVAAWLQLVEERPISLVALVDDTGLAEVTRWLEGGGHDWVFRGHLSLLPTVLLRIEREHEARRAREANESRLRSSTAELVQLARSPRFRGDDLDDALKEITEAGVRGMAVTRCSVWLFDDTHSTLRQVDQYDLRSASHTSGNSFVVSEHRAYLSVLVSQRIIAASNAQTDERTREFNATYHLPEGITSTLDVAVRLRGEMVGMLCFEQVGPLRRWSAAEEVFAGALADVVSLGLEGAERFRVEAALRHSERRFRDLFQHTSDPTILYRVALDGSVYSEDFNPAAEVVTGFKREEVIGRRAQDLLDSNSSALLRERYQQAIRTRTPVLFEHEMRLPTGTKWFNTAVIPLLDELGAVVRLAAIGRDVTSQHEAESLQRKLEAEVAESQKNEALARLASHIAHDVNNLLTVVNAHADRLSQLPGKSAEVAQSILQATARGRDLTQQVLTFGRRRPPERKPLDLGPLVRETTKLLEPTAPSVTIRLDLPFRITRVMGDAGQLQQVITNLCTNALAAIGSTTGTLTVRLKAVEVDYAFAKRNPPLQAGKWVLLSVDDTGQGMDDVTRRRIFEPFFSARPDGRGNGLGLAVVQSIVQGHDGGIVVDTKAGQGSSFQVYLPALEEDQVRPGSGQHLMLVDDHPGMARVSAKLLETLGYRTSVFDDPRDALAAFRAAPQSFDAVLTDLSMPQMSGEDFTRSIRELAPQLPVIVSSGLASEINMDELRSLGVAAVLMKPWRLEEAVATLQRVLP